MRMSSSISHEKVGVTTDASDLESVMMRGDDSSGDDGEDDDDVASGGEGAKNVILGVSVMEVGWSAGGLWIGLQCV